MTITDPARWFAARCASGRETKIIEAIEQLAKRDGLSIEPYMPTVTRWRRVRHHRKNVVREKFERALFPGIIFLKCISSPSAVEEVEGVKLYTRRDGKGDNVPAIMPSRDIEAIRWMHINGEFDETRPKEPDYVPAVGDKAFVENGDVVSRVGEILKIQAKHGTATLLIGKMKVKAGLKTLRPAPKAEEAA
ncbi:transcription termination/antitermination protein NusG [Caulobacter segnis]|uniref:NusG-like N-terminal domain-containing protein n=1 Tax=Caulobacter segnis TaxID=88688 RepID=A0A2W5WQR9_9CAUL|nr:transcription termination/antitermination NusG family protein [Caulobacter segnis]PZR36478.1 MAG: hypothetical protein DI526_03315 [Caulobacter segnis]